MTKMPPSPSSLWIALNSLLVRRGTRSLARVTTRSATSSSVSSTAPAKRPLYRRPGFLIAAAIVLLIAVGVGVKYWLYARSHESTDDAFIDAHITPVSPKVSGYVAKVHVQSNQQVKKGDLLVEIDPRDYQARLDQAKAALSAGEARLKEAQSGVALTRANSRANVQQATGTVQQAQAGVAAQRAQANAERTRVTQAAAGVSAVQANVQQATG